MYVGSLGCGGWGVTGRDEGEGAVGKENKEWWVDSRRMQVEMSVSACM